MPPSPDAPDQTGSDRINELYWNTDRTIDDITEELGISRNALYTSIHPRPAGETCRECGERMVFTNRTHRDTETASCRECGAERDLREPAAASATDRSRQEDRNGSSPRHENGGDASGWSRWRDDLASVEPERYALVGGAAALGVVLGAAAARALRHRM